ncbi:MAG: dioxygenase [Ahniella sp.]|nr:dioxygenase [Ahniella sp.]
MIRSVFLSHGAPLLALDPGLYADRFRELGRLLDSAQSLIVISPHWMTRYLTVGTAASYPAIHDFGGFPSALYQLRHDIAGAPEQSEQLAARLTGQGIPVRLEHHEGVDHGVWMPHRMMALPAAQPIVPISMPASLDATGAYRLGGALAQAMPDAVVWGTGGMTHNLQEFRGQARDAAVDPRVREFAEWMREHIEALDHPALLDYRRRAPHALANHPTDEHLLPLFVALGAAGTDHKPSLAADGYTHGILSMMAFTFAGAR